jgi:hypothetical protein
MARECPFKKTQCPQQKSKPGFKKSNKCQEQQMQHFQVLHQQAKIRAIEDSDDESDLDTDNEESTETVTDIPSIAECTACFTEEEREQWIHEMKNQGILF